MQLRLFNKLYWLFQSLYLLLSEINLPRSAFGLTENLILCWQIWYVWNFELKRHWDPLVFSELNVKQKPVNWRLFTVNLFNVNLQSIYSIFYNEQLDPFYPQSAVWHGPDHVLSVCSLINELSVGFSSVQFIWWALSQYIAPLYRDQILVRSLSDHCWMRTKINSSLKTSIFLWWLHSQTTKLLLFCY